MSGLQVSFAVAAVSPVLLVWADADTRRGDAERRVAPFLAMVAILASVEIWRGPVGAGLAASYLLGTIWLGWRGLLRSAGRSRLTAAELGLLLAHVLLSGGAVWLLVYSARSRLLGFGDGWALLTAAHFHAAGFGALAFSSLLHRATGRNGTVLGLHPVAFTLVAAGLAGLPLLDEAGTLLYVLLFVIQAVLAVRVRPSLAVTLAALAPLVTMGLALDWAVGTRHLDLETMAWTHGAGNAAAHVLLGLGGMMALRPPPRVPRLAARTSRLTAGLRVGPGFLATLAPREPRQPRGISPDLGAYARADFDTAALDPEIVRFYEHTGDYELETVPHWHRGFRLGGWLWGRLAAWVGQLGLPAPGQSAEAMDSRIVDVDDALDGREDVRGWVRVWHRTGRPLYVATYSEHVTRGVRYMNIAMPLPGCNLTSLLRLDREGEHGLVLTSRGEGDQGVYLGLASGRAVRLPLDETIHVAPATGADALSATHDMWLFGLRYLTLSYRIWRRSRP